MSNLPSPLADVLETTAVVRRALAAIAGHLEHARYDDALALVDEAWTQLHELRCRFAEVLGGDLDELDAAVGVLPGLRRQAPAPGRDAPSLRAHPPAAAPPQGALPLKSDPGRDLPLW